MSYGGEVALRWGLSEMTRERGILRSSIDDFQSRYFLELEIFFIEIYFNIMFLIWVL
ncbi:hypothetical protein CKA32_004964 [Geitlerinema sp. FC II]|nr:hypothetical protein CKA32_004964 [Geitlerinema sp. FC II]